MTIATSNRTVLRYVAEVTFGTTPATPALKGIRYTGESINYNIANVTSAEIREDRRTSDLVQVQADVAGDINFELCYDAFDDILEAALGGTWGAPIAGVSTLKDGTSLRSFSIQKQFQDSTANQYFTYRGNRIGGLELNWQTGAIITGKIPVMGLGLAVSASQIAGATFPAGTTNTPMNAVSNVIAIKEDGITSTQFFNRLSVSLNNNLRAQRAVGSLPNIGIALGRIDLTGQIDCYFQDTVIMNKFLAATSFSLELQVRDQQNNTYQIIVPKAKFETGQVVSGGLDQDIMFQGTFRGIYDTVSTSQFQITRDPQPVGP